MLFLIVVKSILLVFFSATNVGLITICIVCYGVWFYHVELCFQCRGVVCF